MRGGNNGICRWKCICHKSGTKEKLATFIFSYSVPVYPRNVGFVAGTLNVQQDPTLPWVKHFYVSSTKRGIAVKRAIDTFAATVDKCKELLGQKEQPVAAYAQIFIPRDAMYEPLCVASGFSLISDRYLKNLNSETGAFASAFVQAVGYAHCYFGCALVTTPLISESWIVHGLAAFLANAALRARCGRSSLIQDGYLTLKHLDGIFATEERRLALDATIGFTLCGGPLRPPPVEFAPMDHALVLLGGLDLVDVLAHGEGGDHMRLRIFFQGVERRWGTRSFWQAVQYIVQSSAYASRTADMTNATPLPPLRKYNSFTSDLSNGSASAFSPRSASEFTSTPPGK